MAWIYTRQVVFCPCDISIIENKDKLSMDKCKHGVYVFVDNCARVCLFVVEGLGVQKFDK